MPFVQYSGNTIPNFLTRNPAQVSLRSALANSNPHDAKYAILSYFLQNAVSLAVFHALAIRFLFKK
jgi:hypothetical protein